MSIGVVAVSWPDLVEDRWHDLGCMRISVGSSIWEYLVANSTCMARTGISIGSEGTMTLVTTSFSLSGFVHFVDLVSERERV